MRIEVNKRSLKYILISNSKGQAVLEYVLLTFMILVVLLAVIISISRNTKIFAQNYFGAYFQCLLELGELPSLGSDGVAETECDESEPTFDPVAGGSGEFPSGAGGNNSSTGDNDDSQSDENGNKNDSSSGDTASSGASDGGGSTNAGSGNFNQGLAGRNQKVPLSNADKRGSKNGANGLSGSPSGTNNFQQAEEFGEDGSGRSPYVPIYGSVDEEKKKEGASVIKTTSEQNPEQALRGKRVPVSIKNPDENKVKDDEGISFPDFIKYLIIAAIFLIIVIFFGGQVMSFQKSKD